MIRILHSLLFYLLLLISYVFLHHLPQLLGNLFFRWPITVAECLIGTKSLTFASYPSRLLCTRGHPKHDTTLNAFGLQKEMVYIGPMYSGHLHTILATFRPQQEAPFVREVIPAADGNPLCIDFLSPQKEGLGLVLLLPGLTSDAQTFYVRRMAEWLVRNGYHVAVLNARGVGNTPLTQPRLFSALFTDDLRHVLRQCFTPEKIMARMGGTEAKPFVAVGFSLGGVIACKYIGEEGEKGKGIHTKRNRKRRESSHSRYMYEEEEETCPLQAVITVTSPYDMHAADHTMKQWTQHVVYSKPLFHGLQRYLHRHMAVVQHLPGIDAPNLFEEPHAMAQTFSTVYDVDTHIIAPHFGFSSAEEYYSAADCFVSLQTACVPVMCVAARDDPICGVPPHIRRWEALIKTNPNVTYVEMPSGGHLGFLGSPLAEWMGEPNQMEKLVLHSLNSFRATVQNDLKATKR